MFERRINFERMVMLLGESSEKVYDGRKSNVQEGKLEKEQDDGKEKDIKREERSADKEERKDKH